MCTGNRTEGSNPSLSAEEAVFIKRTASFVCGSGHSDVWQTELVPRNTSSKAPLPNGKVEGSSAVSVGLTRPLHPHHRCPPRMNRRHYPAAAYAAGSRTALRLDSAGSAAARPCAVLPTGTCLRGVATRGACARCSPLASRAGRTARCGAVTRVTAVVSTADEDQENQTESDPRRHALRAYYDLGRRRQSGPHLRDRRLVAEGTAPGRLDDLG
jgi:hypothetical protein